MASPKIGFAAPNIEHQFIAYYLATNINMCLSAQGKYELFEAINEGRFMKYAVNTPLPDVVIYERGYSANAIFAIELAKNQADLEADKLKIEGYANTDHDFIEGFVYDYINKLWERYIPERPLVKGQPKIKKEELGWQLTSQSLFLKKPLNPMAKRPKL